jgi:putative copper export protein
MNAVEWALRWMALAAIALLTGAVGCEVLVVRSTPAATLRARARPAYLAITRSALALFALAAGLEVVAGWLTGTIAARKVGLFVAQIILVAALLPVLGHRPTLALGGCALLFLTRSLGSRSASLSEWLLPVAADWLHAAAAAFWLGGVAYLLLALVPLALRHSLLGELGAAVARFSPLAVAAVTVIGLTGLMQSASTLGSAADLLTTAYGQALLAKSAGFAALIALGAFHQFAIGPRLRLWRARAAQAEAAARRFRLSLAVEIAVGLGVLAAAAAMAVLPAP